MKCFTSRTGFQVMVLAAVVALYLLFAPNYDWPSAASETPYGADFLQEWIGAKLIVSGNADKLYDIDTFKAWQHDSRLIGFEWDSANFFPPVYPPAHYLLFSPFAILPYRWAVVVWLTALVAGAFISARTIAAIVETECNKNEAARSCVGFARSNWLWVILFLFPSVLFSVTLGQKSVLWLMILCLTWRFLQSQRDFAAGMLFGVLSVKPTLFFLLPLVMLRHRKWQFFAGATTTFFVLWGAALFIVPVEAWIAFSHNLRRVGNYAEMTGYRIEWSCNLMTLAYSLPAPWVAFGKWSFCVPLAIYLLYCVFSEKHYPIVSGEKALLVLATTLAISPHTYHYDLCTLMLPILWLAATSPRQGFAYYAMLAVGVTVAAEVQKLLHVPIVPILLVGIVCELRLRSVLGDSTSFTLKRVVAVKPFPSQPNVNRR